MAAGELNAAGAQCVGGEVQHRRGDHADINDLHTRIHQTANQGRGERGATQATIASDRYGGLPLRHCDAAKGAAQAERDIFIQGGGDDAPDVVGLKNASVELHANPCCGAAQAASL